MGLLNVSPNGTFVSFLKFNEKKNPQIYNYILNIVFITRYIITGYRLDDRE
jgi:hypothetical protein